MCRKISFGEYNKLYKYIWLYLIISLIILFFFSTADVNVLMIDFPKDIIIQQIFDYLGIFILSLLFYSFFYRSENNNQRTISEINISPMKSFSSSQIELIYKENEENRYFSIKQYLILVILLVLAFQIENNYYNVGLEGLDFWMFEMVFISIINSKIFKIEIYLHHKLSIGFIAIVCTPLIILYNFLLIKRKEISIIYIKYIWIIPIGIVSFLLLSFFRNYALCKLKWFLDFKYISPLKFLIWYGFVGSLICLIFGIISTEIKCIDKSTFSDITYFCKINNTIDDISVNYYYDNFFVYFRKLWKKDKTNWYNIAVIFLLLLRIILCFFQNYFSILIVQKLNPIYFIGANSLIYFFVKLATDIYNYVDDRDNYKKSYHYLLTIPEFINVLGILFYLELIEFNFCGLNYNLKKNILQRSIQDSNIELYKDNIEEND